MSKTISVVMPTYNGEKYIEEQLLSIINQTRKPDEIIISDDGSKDKTLDIVVGGGVMPIAEQNGIKVTVLTDNPEHGWVKNYEWASRHATGDIIFNCDQDDIWEENKIELIEKVFEQHPDALYVAHGLTLINSVGDKIGEESLFHHIGEENKCTPNEIVAITKDKYLQPCVSRDLIHCLATCVKRELLQYAIPFPLSCAVDQWEPFCALCHGEAYYINSKLARHRLHESNTTAADPKMGFKNKFIRISKRLKKTSFDISPYYGGKAMCEMMQAYKLENTAAYQEALEVLKLGEQKKAIAESGRIVGTIKLIHLFRTSVRFRRSDPKGLPYQLGAILRGRVKI